MKVRSSCVWVDRYGSTKIYAFRPNYILKGSNSLFKKKNKRKKEKQDMND